MEIKKKDIQEREINDRREEKYVRKKEKQEVREMKERGREDTKGLGRVKR